MILDAQLTLQEIFYKILLPLLLTLIIASVIGYERQRVGKAAGFSAHSLVAFASASVAILQRLMFESELELLLSGVMVDAQSQRIIAQVVTGIGFIGAGAILKDGLNIKGITTATTVWASAMIGIIMGSGYLILGTITGIVISLFIVFRDISRGFNPFKKILKSKEE